jgi:hypothetical protein
MVTESGAENIETMMRAELNDGVFAQSMALKKEPLLQAFGR